MKSEKEIEELAEATEITNKDIAKYHESLFPWMYKGNDYDWCEEQCHRLITLSEKSDVKILLQSQAEKSFKAGINYRKPAPADGELVERMAELLLKFRYPTQELYEQSAYETLSEQEKDIWRNQVRQILPIIQGERDKEWERIYKLLCVRCQGILEGKIK